LRLRSAKAGRIHHARRDKGVNERVGVAIYKWPEKLVIVNQIPRNLLGKVQKSLLKEILLRKLKEQ